MAILFETDCSDLGVWDEVAGNIFVGAGGFSGDGIGSTIAPYSNPWLCKRVSPTPSNILRFRWYQWIPAGSMPFSPASYYIVGALYYTGGSAFSFANRQVSFNTTSTGGLYLARGSYNGTVIATASSPMWIEGQWNLEEVTITVDDTAGSIVWASNGSTILNVSGLDTQALGIAAIDGIELVPQSIAGPTTSLIDNVLLEDLSVEEPEPEPEPEPTGVCCDRTQLPGGGTAEDDGTPNPTGPRTNDTIGPFVYTPTICGGFLAAATDPTDPQELT